MKKPPARTVKTHRKSLQGKQPYKRKPLPPLILTDGPSLFCTLTARKTAR